MKLSAITRRFSCSQLVAKSQNRGFVSSQWKSTRTKSHCTPMERIQSQWDFLKQWNQLYFLRQKFQKLKQLIGCFMALQQLKVISVSSLESYNPQDIQMTSWQTETQKVKSLLHTTQRAWHCMDFLSTCACVSQPGRREHKTVCCQHARLICLFKD